jgi:hypothetical protein
MSKMDIRHSVSTDQIARLFDDYCETGSIERQHDDAFENSIIDRYRTNNRTIIRANIYFEKDKDANPYYSSNTKLHRCSMLLQELCTYPWAQEIPKRECSIINGLYGLLFGYNPEVPLVDKIKRIHESSEDYIKDITYYLTNNITLISRWAGGQNNNNIENDCEFDVELSLFGSISEECIKKVLDDLCLKYDAKWVML